MQEHFRNLYGFSVQISYTVSPSVPPLSVESRLKMLLTLTLAAAALAIDGDTIVIDETHIRIANIDAPEIGHPKCDAELRLGKVARKRMAELLGSGEIVLHPGDPKDGRLTDRYGRTLATVTVDGRDVGEIMIAEGLARPWTGRRQPWCR